DKPLRRRGVRDALEALEQRAQAIELRRWRAIEVLAQLREIGQRVHRDAVLARARREQIREPLAVLVEPFDRHAAPAAAGPRHEIDARLPRAQRRADRGAPPAAGDLDLEVIAFDRDLDVE